MKGQTDFLHAAAQIAGARFVICGSPMFSAGELRERSASAGGGFAGRVHRMAR